MTSNDITVQDILIGNNSVIIKTSEQEYSFNKLDDSTIEGNVENINDAIIKAVEENGLTFKSNFPHSLTLYAHDEPSSSYDYRQIADELNLDEENPLVQEIAGITTEIGLTIKVYRDNSWEVTHVFGDKLEQPYSYTR